MLARTTPRPKATATLTTEFSSILSCVIPTPARVALPASLAILPNFARIELIQRIDGAVVTTGEQSERLLASAQLTGDALACSRWIGS